MDYYELWDGRSETITNRRSTISAAYKVWPWTERSQFTAAMIGVGHADYPNLVCGQIQYTPMGDVADYASGNPGPGAARAICTFIPENEFNTTTTEGDWRETWSLSEEGMLVGKGLIWGSDSKPLDENDEQMIPMPTVTVTYNGTYAAIPSGLQDMIGKVNNSTLNTGWFPFTSGTALLKGAELQDQADMSGIISYRASLVFQYKNRGWGSFLRKDKTWGSGGRQADWDVIKRADGTPLFESANMSTL